MDPFQASLNNGNPFVKVFQYYITLKINNNHLFFHRT